MSVIKPSAGAISLIRWRLRERNIRAHPPTLMRSAVASGSIIPSGPITARFWIPSCFRRCTSSFWAGRQHGLGLAAETGGTGSSAKSKVERPKREPRTFAPNDEELAAHEVLLAKLKNPLWSKTA
jgi:hypothetical protein